MRTIRAERVEFDSTRKIRETESELIVPTIFTRESILPFADGRGYRPAAELARPKAIKLLARSVAVPYAHISTVFLQRQADMCGTVENVQFDSRINGLIGDLVLDKADCDEAFLEGVRSSVLKDVSVAYISEDDFTPGKFGDEPYDFVQRNFVFGHVAVGVPEGRCPSPFCGMKVDEFIVKPRMDPEETEEFVHIRVDDPDDFVDGSFRTIEIDAGKGIKAVVGKLKSDPKGSTHIQKFIFAKSKGWTMEKAQAWVKEHKDEMDAVWTTEYINDLPDSCFAYVEDGEKDGEGKTVPRSKRHLPFKNKEGEVDHDHLVNALARVKQSGTMPEGGKRSAIEKLCSAVRSWNREHSESKIESEVCGAQGDSCSVVALNPLEVLEDSRRLLNAKCRSV